LLKKRPLLGCTKVSYIWSLATSSVVCGPATATSPKACDRCSPGQAWWCTAVIQALRRLRQKDPEYEASLGNLVKHCLKTKKEKEKKCRVSDLPRLSECLHSHNIPAHSFGYY
jgi:hypothetical protein